MKTKNLILFLLIIVINPATAQRFENITFNSKINNPDITITYDLIDKDTTQRYDIKVYCSTDGGLTFNEESLQLITGDLFRVSPGLKKKMVWKAAREYGKIMGDVQFKLNGTGHKTVPIKINTEKLGLLTDVRDGKVYKTIRIGQQIWMAENLAFKTEKGCWSYKNGKYNINKYGYLYNWETAQRACPTGWHLPSDKELEVLLNNCGKGMQEAYKTILEDGDSGFNATLSGFRSRKSEYLYLGAYTAFWSSSSYNKSCSWAMTLTGIGKIAKLYFVEKEQAVSVRCIMND